MVALQARDPARRGRSPSRPLAPSGRHHDPQITQILTEENRIKPSGVFGCLPSSICGDPSAAGRLTLRSGRPLAVRVICGSRSECLAVCILLICGDPSAGCGAIASPPDPIASPCATPRSHSRTADSAARSRQEKTPNPFLFPDPISIHSARFILAAQRRLFQR